MEGEACQYHKFGYCKYMDQCKRKHYSEECQDSKCKSITSCPKRHPKGCKRYASGECRFKNSCAYKHQQPTLNKDQTELNDKLKQIEKVLHALCRKVINLETELEEVKKENIKIKSKEETNKSIKPKSKLSENQKDIPKEKLSGTKDSEDANGLKNKIDDKSEYGGEMFNCDKCKYKSKKETLLKKHMILKHEDHQCKTCETKLPTSIELLKHIATHHIPTTGDKESINDKEEEKVHIAKEHNEQEESWDIKFQSTPKSTKEEDELFDDLLLEGLEEKEESKKDSSFVFRESMLEEFLDKKEN